MNEIEIDATQVTAKPRKLSASWSVDSIEPFNITPKRVGPIRRWYRKTFFKLRKRLGWLTIEEKLVETMADEIRKEFDQTILEHLRTMYK